MMLLLCLLALVGVLDATGVQEVYRPHFRPAMVGNTYRWWCPSPADISPCICDGPRGFPLLICNNMEAAHYLFRVFRSHFPIRDLGKVTVSNSRVGSLERGTFGEARFEYLSMNKNELTRVETGALEGSRESVKRIEIVHSDLVKFPFKEVAGFTKLEHLDLRYNSLTTIPDYAFATVTSSNSNRLKTINLAFNRINYVGAFAFQNLKGLRNLDLTNNKLTVLNNNAFALAQPNPKLTLDISHNQLGFIADGAFLNQMPEVLNLTSNSLKSLPQKHFQAVLSGMATAQNGAIYVDDNRFRCTCDNIAWLLRLSFTYRSYIKGFYCSDLNRRLEDLNMYDLHCY